MVRLFLALSILCVAQLSALTPNKALELLKEGNERFINDKLLHPNRSQERRLDVKDKQKPFAVVIACSDSRVAPVIMFDQGLGDVFVIRVAGNVIAETELESIIYAVDHLNPSLIIVMGHESCGAVHAVVEEKIEGIPHIAKLIKPAVLQARKWKAPDLLKSSIKLNAKNMRSYLLGKKEIYKKVRENTLAVHAAYYNFQTGEVEFIGAGRDH